MKKTKNMHYLSQMISRNFVEKDSPQTFLLYDPFKNQISERNIKKLFSGHKPWGEDFEKKLSGDDYENSLAPILKDLATCYIPKNVIIGPKEIIIAPFNGIVIEEAEKRSMLSKLFFQTVLLQRSNEKPDSQTENSIAKMIQADQKLNMCLVLVEISSINNSIPLVLTDGLLFPFITPNNRPDSAGSVCFMFPLSEKRFLLWVNGASDANYFVSKYRDINYLNLCRIEQHEKKCKIALAKNQRNEKYLNELRVQIPSFDSHDPMPICYSREWE